MAITGIGSTYSNVHEGVYVSSKKEEMKETEGTQKSAETAEKSSNSVDENQGKRYSDVSEYYAYLKDKYPCLTASGYKVTISPVYLEKCINDPECAELLEKNLEHLPVSHQNMTAFWSARGAEVVNEQWNFDENGNCGGGTDMYVASKNSSSSSSVQDKLLKKKTERKFTPQEYYEKKKYLREQFEEKQAEKEMYEKLQKKSTLPREQNTSRVIERYESCILGL